jgi:hypothetical protein
MEHMMNGIELQQAEFAYMLAVIGARAVVGVDDPNLFPLEATEQEEIYSLGREGLEQHGCLIPVEHSPHEYAMNPLLYEATALIAAPDIVVATLRDTRGGERQLVQHYIAGDGIVELSVSTEWNYRLGFLSGIKILYEHIAQMLHVTDSEQSGQFMISEQIFNAIQPLSQKGELEQVAELIASAGVNGSFGASLVEALSSASSGQVVVIRPRSGEIEAGRRAMVFGEGDGAWMLVKTAAGSQEFKVSTFDFDSIGVLIAEFRKELKVAS